MIRIAIDDGHGRETAGKRTPNFSNGTFMKENEFNEAVALYLEKDLKQCGFDTFLVAPETTDTSLKTRVQRANDAHADCYISIHANAFGSGWNDANGLESWIYDKVNTGSETEQFAQTVHKELVLSTGLKNRGLKRSDDLYVLKNTKMHAILVECGFMTNLNEAKLLRTTEYRKKCASAICRGICNFYNNDYKEGVKVGEIEDMTLQEAVSLVQKKAGFEKQTMDFLMAYKYGDIMIKKLAAAMK